MREAVVVRWIQLLLSSMLTVASCRADTSHDDEHACQPQLPEPLRVRVTAEHPGWRVLKPDDLLAEDLAIWRRAYDGLCPGIAVGHFNDTAQTAYAVLLIRPTDGRITARLVVVDASRTDELITETDLSNLPVVRKGMPGTYNDFYDPSDTISTPFETIIYEHLEASAIAFFWQNGRYVSLKVSD